MRRLTFVLLVLVACGDSGGASGAAPDSGALASGSDVVAGDWFACLSAGDCAELQRSGTRYTADGAVYQLSAPLPESRSMPLPPFVPGDGYCVSSPQLGTWTYDAASERLSIEYTASSTPSITVGRPEPDRFVRIDAPNATGTWTGTNCVVD